MEKCNKTGKKKKKKAEAQIITTSNNNKYNSIYSSKILVSETDFVL